MKRILTLSLLFLITTATDLCAMKFGTGWLPPKRSELTLKTIESDLESLVDHLCVRKKQTEAERAVINTLKQEVVKAALTSSKELHITELKQLRFHTQENIRYILAQAITNRACILYKKRFTKKMGTLCKYQEKWLTEVIQDMRQNWQHNLHNIAIYGQKDTLAKYIDGRLKRRIKRMVKKDLQKGIQIVNSGRNIA